MKPARCSTRSGTRTSSPRTGRPAVLYIDLHLVHEVTSPQAFAGLARARPASPASGPHRRDDGSLDADARRRGSPIVDDAGARAAAHARRQLRELRHHAATASTPSSSGIVHVIGPELGLTQPGMTIVCGDSHTSTHGAFGALAFGIGTSEVEHVLATQCLLQRKPKTLEVRVRRRARRGRDREGHRSSR